MLRLNHPITDKLNLTINVLKQFIKFIGKIIEDVE